MRNPNIASMLKYYRKLNKLSVQEVAETLTHRAGDSISTKTVYGWESGNAQPTADTLMYLCELYQVHDVLETFGYENRSPQKLFYDTMTKEEIILVEAYRSHPELHGAVMRLLECDPLPKGWGEDA